MIQITFLGTSCMVPTKERNVQGIFLSYKAEGILIDCGEGTQRQMNIAGINRNRVTRVLISHWHGDHVAGLVGLIQTLGNISEGKTVHIYGPKGTVERMEHLLKMCEFGATITLKINELNPKGVEKFYENEDFYLECCYLEHSVPCLAYNFVEKDIRKIDMKQAKKLDLKEGPLIGKLQKGEIVKFKGREIKPDEVSFIVSGKKISFVLDTALCNSCYAVAENADLLISEAAYASDLDEKAQDYKHMTAKQAALVANKANVKKLVLTHISQRYKTPEKVLEDAKDVFSNTEVAYDFMKIKL